MAIPYSVDRYDWGTRFHRWSLVYPTPTFVEHVRIFSGNSLCLCACISPMLTSLLVEAGKHWKAHIS